MDCISFSQITKNKIRRHSQFDPQIEVDFKSITESILIKGISHTTNINLKDNVIEHTPSESSARNTIFFINKKYLQQPRNNLNLYKSGYLEFVYVGIILQKRSSIITGCIQRHPSTDICTFNDYYFNPLLEKLLKENHKKNFLQIILIFTC